MVEADREQQIKPPACGKARFLTTGRALGAFLSLVLLTVLFCFGFVAAGLATGKLSLDAFRPSIVGALQQRLGGSYQLQINGMSLQRESHGLALALKGLSVAEPNGQKLIAAPQADIYFDPFSLLLGQIKPTRVDIADLEVELHVLPDGAVALTANGDEPPATSAPQPEAPASQAPPVAPGSSAQIPQTAPAPSTAIPSTATPTVARAKVIRQAAMAINTLFDIASGRDSPIAKLDHFGIEHGRLVFDDQTIGEKRKFDNFEFMLDHSHGAANIWLSARGPNGRWSVKGAAHGARNEAHGLTFEAQGFSIDEIALMAGRRNLGIDTDIPISIKVEAGFEGDGHVLQGNARFALGAGFLHIDNPDFAPWFIDEAVGAAHWDVVGRKIVIDEAQYFSGPTRFFLHGVVTPPAQEQAPWDIGFQQTEAATIGPDRLGEKTVTVAQLAGALRLDLEAKQLAIQHFEMSGPEVAVAAQGTLDWVEGPHIRMGLSAGQMTAAGVKAVWPHLAAAPVRGWMGDHLLGGTLLNAKLAIDLDAVDLLMMRADHPPMDDRILADYAVKDVSFTFLDGAPPVLGLTGQGHATGRTTRFAATTASMESGPGRHIALSEGLLLAPDLATQPIAMTISARGEGSLEVLGEILSKPGFAKYASLPIDPKTTKGQFAGNFTFRTLLVPDPKPSDFSLKVDATVDNFSAEKLIGKERLEQGKLVVNVDSGNIRVTGAGRVFGAPATLDLQQAGDQPAIGVIGFSMDEAARAKAGLTTGATIGGPVAVKVTATLGGPRQEAKVELDLTKASLNYPVPGLFKPAGRPSKANFNYREEEKGGSLLDQIVFDAGGAMARGSAQLGPEGGIVGAKFNQLKFSPGDNMQLDALKTGDVLKLTVRGAAIDARPFIKGLSAPSPPSASDMDFDLDLKATLITGSNRQIISNADLRLAKKNGGYSALGLNGKLGRDALATYLTRPDGGPPLLRIGTSDAGALLGFLDIYSHMENGQLDASLRLDGTRLYGGVDIENFRLRGEPAMRSFANAAPEQTVGRIKLDPSVVDFSRLHAKIDKNNGRLQVEDGVISSPNIGSTIEGWVDFNQDTLNLSGTFVPAYSVNNFFGKIPVVGAILGGGAQEGLFGLNFRVTGQISSPTLSVNPLSAIAPGFLRKIFGVMPPSDGGKPGE